MSGTKLQLHELAETLPAEWPESLLPDIQAKLNANERTLVVLDDDPTGTQTVHDVTVLTEWSVASLRDELARREPAFFVLTNSRAMALDRAQALSAEVGGNLREASHAAGRDFAVVSRSDSTLRGHYPGEVDALAAALGQTFDATLIIPYFEEGGRYTIGNTHFVAEGDSLIPAAETPFAKDAVFGYHSSDLRAWVEEKTSGRVVAEDVRSVGIDLLRIGGPSAIAGFLMDLADEAVCVVNAACMRDMEVFVDGLLQAEAAGKRFLYRTAASFVKVRAGIEARPLLRPSELALPSDGGGLFVVGSYVPKTTAQLSALLAHTDTQPVAVSVPALLDTASRADEVERAAEAANRLLDRGADAAIYTGRELVTGTDSAANLEIGRQVSAGLVDIVRRLAVRPRYLVAKGGITSSDIATRALNIRRARVLGQVLPGVPVWQTGPESVYAGLAYVVFPGNVGGENALVEVASTLRGPDQ
ncbi:MAG: four-carbon acid sugar kinase family protein [Caldilineaceae bacterium]